MKKQLTFILGALALLQLPALFSMEAPSEAISSHKRKLSSLETPSQHLAPSSVEDEHLRFLHDVLHSSSEPEQNADCLEQFYDPSLVGFIIEALDPETKFPDPFQEHTDALNQTLVLGLLATENGALPTCATQESPVATQSTSIHQDNQISQSLRTKKKTECETCHKFFTIINLHKCKAGASPTPVKEDKTSTSNRPFKCTFGGCNKSFGYAHVLKRHEIIHTGIKPFECSYEGCSITFSDKGDKTKHERTHTNTRLFECNECPKTFTRKESLNNHRVRFHQKNQPLSTETDLQQIDIPDNSRETTLITTYEEPFTNAPPTVTEDKTSTSNRPFKCTFGGCNKSFGYAYSLKRHEIIHKGIKPFKCSYEGCNKSFDHAHVLKRHEIIHTDIKPFECSYEGCNKSFSDKSCRNRHERTHTNTRPFECNECPQTFTRKDSLNNHRVRSHPEKSDKA